MIIFRWLFACAVVFAGLWAASRAIRRPGVHRASVVAVERLGAVSLGPRRALVAVRLGSEVRGLVLHEHGVTDLGLVTGWPEGRAVADAPSGASEAPSLRHWLPFGEGHLDWLERLRVLGPPAESSASMLAASAETPPTSAVPKQAARRCATAEPAQAETISS